MTTRSFTRFRC